MKNNEKPLLCFVIGPIGKESSIERKHADLLLHSVIKHVLESDEFGYKVKRADEDADPGMIGDRVISDIIQASLVVADLTDLNPNAFYELGIRHSTELPTIHIARSGTALPFDNVAHRTIFVDLTDWQSIQGARNRLAESARAIRSPQYKVSNPITQANASFKMRQSEDPRDRLIAEMHERISSLEVMQERNKGGPVSEEISEKFADEIRRLWKEGFRSSKLISRVRIIARQLGIELNDISVEGDNIFFESPQLDYVGLGLDTKGE